MLCYLPTTQLNDLPVQQHDLINIGLAHLRVDLAILNTMD